MNDDIARLIQRARDLDPTAEGPVGLAYQLADELEWATFEIERLTRIVGDLENLVWEMSNV